MRTSELPKKISNRILQDIFSGTMEGGEHISAQQVADRYGVSRTPVREALILLEEQNVLVRMENRGYFVAEKLPQELKQNLGDIEAGEADGYQLLADDWLTNEIPEEITEQFLKQRYAWTKAKINDVLMRAAREGWAERKEGYGWRLLPVAKSAEAFDAIYRFRMAIEPAAMLEPSFELDKKILSEQRAIQEGMLEKDLGGVPAQQLLLNGSLFHEEIMKLSNNLFFLTSLKRVNRMRRLMEYRATVDHERILGQCSEHLEILDLLEKGQIAEASYLMRRHLSGALKRKSPIVWNNSSDTINDQLDTSPDVGQA